MARKYAIVSTIKVWDDSALRWAMYHEALGFDPIYVFCDSAATTQNSTPAARVIVCDRAYWRQFAEYPLYHLLDPRNQYGTPSWGSPQSVMLRQALNVESAISSSIRDGVGWLLHIDGDELFHCPDVTVSEHFDALCSLQITRVRYLNMESIVLPREPATIFGQERLFKINPTALSELQRRAVGEIRGELPYFLSYSNGKSATRISSEVHCSGVHDFRNLGGETGMCHLTQPTILHFPYSSYEQFQEKHESLGEFDSSSIFGDKWRPPAVLIAAERCVRSKDRESLRRVYDEWVVWDEACTRRLSDVRVVQRIAVDDCASTGESGSVSASVLGEA